MLLYIKHVQARHTVATNITSSTLYVHIATCAKGFVAGTGQHYHADVLCFAAVAESIAHFCYGKGSEGVAITRTVYGDTGDAVVFVEEYFLVGFNGCPVSHYIIGIIILLNLIYLKCLK